MTAHESSSAKRAPKTQRGPHAPKHIVIEGPLRVGKSTLARILAERLHARRVYDCEDNPFLAEFYKEEPGSALRAQMYFLMERQKRLREALAVDSPAPLLSDFLMEKDRIFANLNLDDEELKLYERYYELLARDIPPPDLVIYLDAPAEVLFARKGEKTLQDLEARRQAFIRLGKEIPNFVLIDGTQPLEAVYAEVNEHIIRFCENRHGKRRPETSKHNPRVTERIITEEASMRRGTAKDEN